jgi:NAD-dependent deacetylase
MDKIDRVVNLLSSARRLLFITGAGVSADSGLPTYRGIGGLYNDGATEEGFPVEEALDGEMMERNPALPWKYLAMIERACRKASYNRAHEVIAAMESVFEVVWVLTQNIDGFHRAAGSSNIIDIHGDLHNLFCVSCDYRCTVENYEGLAIPPFCPDCGALVRPDVVLFGEMLSWDKCDTMARVWREGIDMVFTVGTTSVFPYISQPVIASQHMGIPTVEINPDSTYVSNIIDIRIAGRAAETLDAVWNNYAITKKNDNREDTKARR